MSTTQDRTASLAVLLALQVVTVDRRVICAPIEVRLELGFVCPPVRAFHCVHVRLFDIKVGYCVKLGPQASMSSMMSWPMTRPLGRHFSKMSFNERKEHAFKMYRDLTSNKEKFAVALAFGYGPNVVFNTNVQEASKRWRCTIVAPREARSSSVTHLISPKPSTPRAFSAGPNPLNHER